MGPSLRPLTDDEVAASVRHQVESYIADRVASGENPGEARMTAREQAAGLFPEGKPAPGHVHYRVLDEDGVDVGRVWIGPRIAERTESLWVWNIEIDEGHRGRGLGRAAMVLAEQEARARGATELGLNVFGFNTVARRLYESLGYQPTVVTMRKPL